MVLSRGSRVGPYEILDLLGEGGMGAVYRARDPRLDRDVAIKVLRADVVGDRERQARFLQEAKAASALNHPNIVTVNDVGTQGDVTYLVMELVVQYVDLATRRVTDILVFDKPPDLGLALSPDRKTLLFSKLDYIGTDMMLVEGFQ